MPNFSAFGANDRATSIGDLIALKPTEITIKRTGDRGGTLDPQTVRLETLASQRMVVGEGGVTHMCDAMALAHFNHPVQPDVDIQVGDRFVADSVAYEAVLIMPAHQECRQVWLKVRA